VKVTRRRKDVPPSPEDIVYALRRDRRPYRRHGERVATKVAQEVQSTLTSGGQRYDKWYKVIKDKTPEKAHPACPKDKKYEKKQKFNCWCRECRGWGYLGKDGARHHGAHRHPAYEKTLVEACFPTPRRPHRKGGTSGGFPF
jgi:hypothetical protein